jgi:DNA-binding NtrC family response regulator
MRGEAGALAGLVGRCPAIESLKRELALLGRGDAKVHVFGETGTGKEKVARALH